MKRLTIIVVLVSFAGVCSWFPSVYEAPVSGEKKGNSHIEYAGAGNKVGEEDKSDSGLQTGEGDTDLKDPDSERSLNIDKKRDEDAGIIARLKEYSSIRKR